MANTIAQGFTLLDQNGNPLGSASNPIQTALAGTGLVRLSATSAPPEVFGTQVEASTTVAAAASGSVSLPGAASLQTFCRGFIVSSVAAAAVVSGLVTLTGLANTLNFEYTITVASGGLLIVTFGTGVPASAVNTPIVLNFPAIAGGSATALAIWGVQF